MPCIRTSPSSSSSASAAGAPVIRKTTFAQLCARGPIKPKARKAGSPVTKESDTTATTTTMAATKSSRSPASSPAARAPVNRKITFEEYRARGTIKPREPSSAGSKESTSTSTTTAAAPPSPACSFSLSPASSPPASPSPAPSRLAPADVRRDTSWTIPVETRDTKLPGNPLVTKNVRVANPLVRPKPKPRAAKSAAATLSSPAATRSPSPVAAHQSTPSDDEFDYLFNEPSDEDEFDDLFNEPPPPKAAVQATKEARREAALARSAKITTGAIARAGNNPMANTRARLNRIDKSATSKSARNSGKISRGHGGSGGARKPKSKSKSKLGNLAGSSGRWVEAEPPTPLEAEEAARRAAEMEQYRREVDRLLAEAPRNNSGGCVAVLGDSRMSTVGFGNNLRERRPEENPMWTTNAAVLRGQGGLKY